MTVSATDTQRQLGRYRVLDTLGTGAMGTVYRGRDESLGREVAIKTIKTLGHGGELAEEMFRERFQHEARAVARLAHPNIVQVFDLGVEGDTPFMVMELVDGPSLKETIARGDRLDERGARALGVQVARALEAAHERGILHRDVKPANVLRAGDGWKLADFGVAHVPDSSLTMTGQFVGSPAYAAPEALALGEISPAADVYALAATLYEALTGKMPHAGGGAATANAVLARPPPTAPSAAGAACSPELDAILLGALDRDPAHRPTAAELAAALAGGAARVVAAADAAKPAEIVRLSSPSLSLSGPVFTSADAVAARRRQIIYAATGLAIALILGVMLGSSGGDDDRDRGAGEPAPMSSVSPLVPAPIPVPVPLGGPVPPTITPPASSGSAELIVPANQRDKALKEWDKIIEKVGDGKLDESWRKLDDFERRFGPSPATRSLRAQLASAGATGHLRGRED